jgi:hypothetical protein
MSDSGVMVVWPAATVTTIGEAQYKHAPERSSGESVTVAPHSLHWTAWATVPKPRGRFVSPAWSESSRAPDVRGASRCGPPTALQCLHFRADTAGS